MDTKNDGGYAFPHQLSEHDMICGGLSIRDYFAAAALQASWSDAKSAEFLADLAKNAYKIADAMLKARAE